MREPIIRRGERVATSMAGIVGLQSRRRAAGGQAMGVLQKAACCKKAADLPDVSKCFHGIGQSIHASDRQATLHGVVFDILDSSRVGVAAGSPSRRARAQAALARWAD